MNGVRENEGRPTKQIELDPNDRASHMLRTQSWAFDGGIGVANATYDEHGRVATVSSPAV